MNASPAAISYQRAAVHEATPAGLMVILYDMLANDLRTAVTAMRGGSIERRSASLKHAFSVLELLEGSLNWDVSETGGARALAQFYSHLRQQLLVAQFHSDGQLLSKQIALILDVRETWRQIDSDAATERAGTPSAAHANDKRTVDSLDDDHQVRWSA